ncbi:MAG TPA: hypothetical protein VK468_00390 [Pyrinomonadaceae bacterium]|nr:hypothetical protein [Pyrinomonadaceae bacterium]
MTADEITKYLTELNDELRLENIKGEITIYGGAVMCLVYDARPATKYVDAIFKPSSEIRLIIERIAERNGLPPDWLNDGLKGYLVSHPQRILLDLSNLKVFVPEPDYMLAIKAMSARADTYDQTDVRILIDVLGLKAPAEVFAILEKYYPRQQIKPATQYFIEELFGK